MCNALWNFIRERYPLQISLPLSLILSVAPLWDTQLSGITTGKIWFSIFSILLILRIADDLSDIQLDRILHPERGLPSGKINLPHLKKAAAVLGGGLIIINRGWLVSSLIFLGIGWYFLYFKNKAKIPIRYQYLLTNLIFFLIPFYDRLAGSADIDYSTLWLGLFIGFSVVAHDIAHSIDDPVESKLPILAATARPSPIVSSILAAGGYLLAGVSGIVFFISADHPVIFLLVFILTSIQIGALLLKLIRQPVSMIAHSFYVTGFIYFLLPLTGLILDGIKNLIKFL